MIKYKVIKDILKNHYHWLKTSLKKGEIVYGYTDCTYGCISPLGIAVTHSPNEMPFFEVPNSHIREI